MTKTTLNFCLDVTLLVLFLALVWVSTVVRFVFPPPTAASGWTLWGYGYGAWAAAQFNLVMALVVTILLHVMLHWSWVCGVIAARISKRRGRCLRSDDGTQTLYGVGTLAMLLIAWAAAYAWAKVSVQSP